jgi:hypothetical protein
LGAIKQLWLGLDSGKEISRLKLSRKDIGGVIKLGASAITLQHLMELSFPIFNVKRIRLQRGVKILWKFHKLSCQSFITKILSIKWLVQGEITLSPPKNGKPFLLVLKTASQDIRNVVQKQIVFAFLPVQAVQWLGLLSTVRMES